MKKKKSGRKEREKKLRNEIKHIKTEGGREGGREEERKEGERKRGRRVRGREREEERNRERCSLTVLNLSPSSIKATSTASDLTSASRTLSALSSDNIC